MSSNQRHKSLGYDTGLTTIVGTSGTTLTARTFTGANGEPGTVSALVGVTIATGSLTLQPKWQASEDSTNWYDIAGTAITAITATDTTFLDAPKGTYRFLRVAILTAGNTATASDKYRVWYNYDRPRLVNG